MAPRYVLAVGARRRVAVALSFAISVVVASMLPAPADPLANPGPLGLIGVDKWIHLGTYALMAFLGAFVASSRSMAVLVTVVAVTTLFGVGVELLQGTIAWRTMERADALANTVGAVVGVCVWHLVWLRLPVRFRAPADA